MKKLGIMLAVVAMVFVGTATYAQSPAPAQKAAKTEKTAPEKKAHKGTHKHHASKKAQKPAESNK